MARIMQKTLKALMLMMMCFVLIAPANIFAAEKPSVQLGVDVVLKGELPEPEESYTIFMQDEAGEIQNITIEGEGHGKLPLLSFDKVGVYTYTIWQEAGENETCTYDDSIYQVKISVTNEEDGDGLETAVAVYRNQETEKSGEIQFTNKYMPDDIPVIEEPDNSARDQEGDGPYTGDMQNLVLYLTLLTTTALMLIVLRKKNHR